MSQYDRYEFEILQVIKEGVFFSTILQHSVLHLVFYIKLISMLTGSEVGLKEKDTRLFLSHAGCRAGLNLLKGQYYLIISPSSDVWHAGSDKNRQG